MWSLCLLSKYVNIVSLYFCIFNMCENVTYSIQPVCDLYNCCAKSIWKSHGGRNGPISQLSCVFHFNTEVKLSKILSKYWLVWGVSSLCLSLWRRTLKRFLFLYYIVIQYNARWEKSLNKACITQTPVWDPHGRGHLHKAPLLRSTVH